ncbi:hypothetical protein NFI96_007287 [Prochilodus magdalenae]|nr:hypothetical protein NFI96_007287 [Prochilodus magdalenae]
MSLPNTTGTIITEFVIGGFDAVQRPLVIGVVMLIVYVLVVIANLANIYFIIMDKRLHQPMYLFICNLAVVDMIYCTSACPTMIGILIAGYKTIPYVSCIIQMSVFQLTSAMEMFAISVMAFDRFIAIGSPLRYQSILTNVRCVLLTVALWMVGCAVMSVVSATAAPLSICNPVLKYIFCDYAAVLRASCIDPTPYFNGISILSLFLILGTFGFICLSYVKIFVVVVKMSSVSDKKKAFNTCLNHLVVIVCYYAPKLVLIVFTRIGVVLTLEERNGLLVGNRPHEGGLRARRPVVGPVLTGQHRRARLAFATEHQNWQICHRRLVLFTDESRFYLSTCDRRDRLWRRRGECYPACNIIQHDWFGGGPYAGAVGPGFLLVHNNARPHVARVCRQFLENEGIDTIDWRTGSPDLNPIEHLWDIMFRSIRRHQVAPQAVQELSDALVQIWEEIPQDTIRRLIRSIPVITEFVFRGFDTVQSPLGIGVVLLLLYMLVMIANTANIYFIVMDKRLHQPMYLFICNLAFVDILSCTSSCLSMIGILIAGYKSISYGPCIVQMFTFHLSGVMEMFTISAMAFDRLIAISHPLRYHSILTNARCVLVTVALWVAGSAIMSMLPATVVPLRVCYSAVKYMFCDYASIIRSTCADPEPYFNLSAVFSFVVIFGTFGFICLSYLKIVIVVVRMSSNQDKKKAFNTCFSHLIVIICYYAPTFTRIVLTRVGVVLTVEERNGLMVGWLRAAVLCCVKGAESCGAVLCEGGLRAAVLCCVKGAESCGAVLCEGG